MFTENVTKPGSARLIYKFPNNWLRSESTKSLTPTSTIFTESTPRLINSIICNVFLFVCLFLQSCILWEYSNLPRSWYQLHKMLLPPNHPPQKKLLIITTIPSRIFHQKSISATINSKKWPPYLPSSLPPYGRSKYLLWSTLHTSIAQYRIKSIAVLWSLVESWEFILSFVLKAIWH